MPKVSSVLGSRRYGFYGMVKGVKHLLLRQHEVLKILDISKPTFSKFVARNILKKVWVDGTPRNPRDYYITGQNVEEVKKKMAANWKQGKSLLDYGTKKRKVRP